MPFDAFRLLRMPQSKAWKRVPKGAIAHILMSIHSERGSHSLDGMRASLDMFKAQSEESFAFIAQAKAALPTVEDLRVTIDDSLKGARVCA